MLVALSAEWELWPVQRRCSTASISAASQLLSRVCSVAYAGKSAVRLQAEVRLIGGVFPCVRYAPWREQGWPKKVASYERNAEAGHREGGL